MPLTTLIDLTGPVGWTAMLMPFAALAVAILFALLDRPRKGRTNVSPATEAAPPATEAMRAAVAAPVEAARGAPTPAPPDVARAPVIAPAPAPASRVAAPVAPHREVAPPASPAPQRAAPIEVAAPRPATPAAASPPAPVAERPPPPPEPPKPVAPPKPVVTPEEIADIERRIRAAVAKTDEASVARLSLELAQKLAFGNDDGHDVEAYLRRSILIAMRLRDTETHALARLELGDRVGARGDMITACEHWQIARQIYWDGSKADGLAEADRRMIANGCPTDWVLNDF